MNVLGEVQELETQLPPHNVLPEPQPHWLLLCLVSGAVHLVKQALALETYSIVDGHPQEPSANLVNGL